MTVLVTGGAGYIGSHMVLALAETRRLSGAEALNAIVAGLEVMVRIDGTHSYHGWNWVRGHFLSMDKGTTRGLIGSQVFKVEVRTGAGGGIAEFSPGGLNLDRVHQACDLKPKKPSKN